ncbi:MAG: HAD family phosphatase [bacterium]
MTKVKDMAVIFDMDGVIVDTTEGHYLSFVQMGKEIGYEMSRERFKFIFGMHNNDIFPLLLGHKLSQSECDKLSNRKEELFRNIIRGNVSALPGVIKLIPALKKAGFKIALGTSTAPENVELVLTDLKLMPYFDGMATAIDVVRGKPDPQVFLIAAKRVGIEPSQCVVIEDAVAGVQAALSAGMKAIGVTINHSREALSAAHFIVDSLEEVTPDDFYKLITS